MNIQNMRTSGTRQVVKTSGLLKVVKSLKRIDYDFAHSLFKTFEFHAISVYLIFTYLRFVHASFFANKFF